MSAFCLFVLHSSCQVRSLAESPGDHTAVLVVEVEGIEQILASMPIAGKYAMTYAVCSKYLMQISSFGPSSCSSDGLSLRPDETTQRLQTPA